MNQLLNTLYVTTPEAWLRLEGETVCVEIEQVKKLQVPLHHLGAVVVFGAAGLSPALMARCAKDGRAVVFHDRNGRFQARVEGATSGNVLLRQAQYQAQADVARTLKLARAFVFGKVRNARAVLLRAGRENQNEGEAAQLKDAADRVGRIAERVPSAPDLDGLRGLEGDAARMYFEHFTLMIRPAQREAFRFETRTRRPPRDPMNALLSFCYALLMNDVRSAVEGAGLDAQFGFLHALRPGRAALALDLMEEFRPSIADRVALTLVNREQVTRQDFDERPGNTVLLKDDARKTVLATYQERKKEELQHSLLAQPVAVGLLPHLQARLLARTLRGDMADYPAYAMR